MNIGATVWYKGLKQSVQGNIAVNEMRDDRVKVVFSQPQFVAVSPTGMVHETVSVYCEARFVHLLG